MMENKQEVFTNFMNEFVSLNTSQKNNEIIEKHKLMLALLTNYASTHGINFEPLKSREINDIADNNGTNDDYLEALMVYTHNIEELIGLILANKD